MTRDRALELAEALVHERRLQAQDHRLRITDWDDVATQLAAIREEEPPPALLLEHIAEELDVMSYGVPLGQRLRAIASTLRKIP